LRGQRVERKGAEGDAHDASEVTALTVLAPPA
jgi:hypothetical protein